MSFDRSPIRWNLERLARCIAGTHSAACSPFRILWNPSAPAEPAPRGQVSVPREFLESALVVSCHRNPEPWRVLYTLLFRLTHGERRVLELESAPDVLEFRLMQKSVRRDMRKMHAFVRFRRTKNEEYMAWYRPDHDILRVNADFFVRRFGSMRWAILTPTTNAFWPR